MNHPPIPTTPTQRSTKSKHRVLNAVVSQEALTQARLAALQSDMKFKAYLDQLLRQAKPFNTPHVNDHLGSAT